jgi:hypothetical protein
VLHVIRKLHVVLRFSGPFHQSRRKFFRIISCVGTLEGSRRIAHVKSLRVAAAVQRTLCHSNVINFNPRALIFRILDYGEMINIHERDCWRRENCHRDSFCARLGAFQEFQSADGLIKTLIIHMSEAGGGGDRENSFPGPKKVDGGAAKL